MENCWYPEVGINRSNCGILLQIRLDDCISHGLYTHISYFGGSITTGSLGLYSKEKISEISTRLGDSQTPTMISFGKDSPLFEVR